MKKITWIILLGVLLLALASCSGGEETIAQAEVIDVNTAQASETFVPGEDVQLQWNDSGSVMAQCCTATEEGYYFLDGQLNSKIYYHDFATDTTVPLCNRPDCSHDSPECNASMAQLGMFIYHMKFYDGNLYVFGGTMGKDPREMVCRISADGTTRGMVATLRVMSAQDTLSKVLIHRGYLYYAPPGPDATQQGTSELYRVSLGGGGEPELLQTFDRQYGSNLSITAYGNYLYVGHRYYLDGEMNEQKMNIYRYDIHTGEQEFLLETTGRQFLVKENSLFYVTMEGVMVYDLETGAQREILKMGQPSLVLDGDRLYCDNRFYLYWYCDRDYSDRAISVIDINTMEVLTTIPLPETGDDGLAGVCGGDIILESYLSGPLRGDLETFLSGGEVEWEVMIAQ